MRDENNNRISLKRMNGKKKTVHARRGPEIDIVRAASNAGVKNKKKIIKLRPIL